MPEDLKLPLQQTRGQDPERATESALNFEPISSDLKKGVSTFSGAVDFPSQSHLDQPSSDDHNPQHANGNHQQERVEAVGVFQSGLIKLESS